MTDLSSLRHMKPNKAIRFLNYDGTNNHGISKGKRKKIICCRGFCHLVSQIQEQLTFGRVSGKFQSQLARSGASEGQLKRRWFLPAPHISDPNK